MFSKSHLLYSYLFLILQIVIFGSLPFIAPAQQLTYDIQYFSSDEGLSDHRITRTLEHSNGFTWVGTFNGLNRFDGYECVPIDLPVRKEFTNGSLDHLIHNLLELEDGTIAVIYSLNNDIAILYDPKLGKSEEVILTKIDEAKGILNFEKRAPLKFLTTKKEETLSEGTIYDRHGNIFKFESKQGKKFAHLILKTGETLDLSEIWGSLISPQVFGNNFSNIIYFASLNGLVKLNIHRSLFKTYFNKPLKDWGYNLSGRAILDIGNSKILFSIEQKGLALLDKTTGEINYIPLINKIIKKANSREESANIRAIFPENDSIIWLTTYYFSGLIRLNIKSNVTTSFLKKDHLNNTKFISSIYTKNGKILIVTHRNNGGNKLISFDPVTKKREHFEFATATLSKVKLRSTCLLESKNGHIWVGTTLGLFLFDLKNKKIVNSYFNKDFSNKDTSTLYPKNYLLSANSILSLYENDQHQLFIGLEGGGLNILNIKTGDFEVFNTSDGLANNTVCSILPNENGYWLGTYNGLSFFDDQNKTFRNFYRKHGLPHNEFNRFSATQDSAGINYFGGMNGFVSFDPREVLKQNDSIKILLSKAIYFDQDGSSQLNQTVGLENNSKISIPSNNRNCSFLMSMTDFKNAANHQFEYQLKSKNSIFEEDDAIWQSNGRNRKIQFEYLPAGNYDLNIRGTSSEGIVTNEFTIQLQVKEFFYKSWWFITLCILALTFLIYFFYQNKLNRALEIEKLRTRLSSDLHDDVGSVLSGVAYQMELLEYSVPEKNKSLVQQIAASSRRAMSQMRDVVWAIDTRNNSIQDLIERMQEFVTEIIEPLEINFDFQHKNLPLKKDISTEVRHSMLLIFKEFLTNTIKHADASNITIQLFKKGKNLEMIIQDNGKGLPKDTELSTGQGLENMKMRAWKIKASLDFLEKNGFGVHLKVPAF